MFTLFHLGQRTGKKFDAREVADKMATTTKPGTSEFRFAPSQILTWQQVSSYWSAYGRKIVRHEPGMNDVEVENGKIMAVEDNAYDNDPNLDSEDKLVQSSSANVLKNIAE